MAYEYGKTSSHMKAREVEGYIQNIRESRKEWHAKLEELDREMEQEQAVFTQLRARQTVAEKRLEARHREGQATLSQQIRAKYQDPPGTGYKRMAILLHEIDEHSLRKRKTQ